MPLLFSNGSLMVFINTTKNWTISNTMLLCLFAVRHILLSFQCIVKPLLKWFLSFFSFLAIFCVGICWFNYYRRDYSYRDWARREAMLLLLEREEQVTKIKKLHAIRRLFLNLFITGFTLHQQKLRRPRKAWAANWRRVGWCHRFDLEGRHWFSEKRPYKPIYSFC